MADSSSGGGDDNPHDYDDFLASNFMASLMPQVISPSSTINPYRILDKSYPIYLRMEQVSQCLMLLSKDLQPIAEALAEIIGPSDRQNGQLIANKAATKLGLVS